MSKSRMFIINYGWGYTVFALINNVISMWTILSLHMGLNGGHGAENIM